MGNQPPPASQRPTINAIVPTWQRKQWSSFFKGTMRHQSHSLDGVSYHNIAPANISHTMHPKRILRRTPEQSHLSISYNARSILPKLDHLRDQDAVLKQARRRYTCIWRHGSASILGTTRTVTRAPMLMYWAGLSRIASPRERRSK